MLIHHLLIHRVLVNARHYVIFLVFLIAFCDELLFSRFRGLFLSVEEEAFFLVVAAFSEGGGFELHHVGLRSGN